MSKYNTCEITHRDIDGFFAEVAQAGIALRVARALGSPEPTLLARPITPGTLLGLEPYTGFVDPQSPNGKQAQAAHDCAKAIIDEECTQFQLTPEDSLATFNVQAKPVSGEI